MKYFILKNGRLGVTPARVPLEKLIQDECRTDKRVMFYACTWEHLNTKHRKYYMSVEGVDLENNTIQLTTTAENQSSIIRRADGRCLCKAKAPISLELDSIKFREKSSGLSNYDYIIVIKAMPQSDLFC